MPKQKKSGNLLNAQRTISDVNYVDYRLLLSNTPPQAESLMHNLEQTAIKIESYVISDKTCFLNKMVLPPH